MMLYAANTGVCNPGFSDDLKKKGFVHNCVLEDCVSDFDERIAYS